MTTITAADFAATVQYIRIDEMPALIARCGRCDHTVAGITKADADADGETLFDSMDALQAVCDSHNRTHHAA